MRNYHSGQDKRGNKSCTASDKYCRPCRTVDGVSIGEGAGSISLTGDGASDTGLGDKAGAGLRDITGPRAGAGDGDFS